MSNRRLIELWGATPNFACVVDSLDKLEGTPELRTFFKNYMNPIGLEVEAEGINKRVPEMRFWTHTEDGSLRNHGREFISQPLGGRQIDYALAELEAVLKRYPDLSWSHRTSIHVHQNFSTMREKQLLAYVMVYGLFEELFYSMVAPYRAANAFCYKATSVDPQMFSVLTENNKYCGLNLFPLKRQSTVEFRQMHGSDDFRLIRRWLQLIVKLHNWVEKQPSNKVVELVTAHIEQGTFVTLAKEIWGINSTLFTHDEILNSANKNALWSLCLSNVEFR